MNFGIVIPAHNEGDFIEKTLESLLKQTKASSQIVVVDDCSTDSTSQILEKIKLKNPSLVIIRREEGATHLPGSKVVRAFNSGLPFLKDDIDVICKFDADLVFPPDYLDILEKHFTENQKIGMCGGFCYVEKNGDWVLESLTDKDHLRGAVKAYRKACFSDIGGLKTTMGWDTVDELLARFYGWEVKTDEVLKVKHLRPTGAGYNLNARFLQGSVFYRLRYGFLLSVLASAKLAFKKKKWSLFKDYLRGYFKAKREKQEFLVTPEQGKWIRHYRWNKILTKIF